MCLSRGVRPGHVYKGAGGEQVAGVSQCGRNTEEGLVPCDSRQGPMRLPGRRAFPCPHLSLTGNRFHSFYDLPEIPNSRSKQLLVREGRGRETREELSETRRP